MRYKINFKEDKSMSELQNENTKVMVSEDAVSTTPANEESKDDSSLGKLGIALIGLAAIGTYTVGKAAVKGCMHVVNKIKEKKAGSKVSEDYDDADFVEKGIEDVELEDIDFEDEDKNKK